MATNPKRTVVIVGGGSASFLAALTLQKALPDWNICQVRSRSIPVIGVGESTTVALPKFLHSTLGIERNEFYREVRPSWKLGVRFEWGEPGENHFNYPFDTFMTARVDGLRKVNATYCAADLSGASLGSAIMDQGRSPILVSPDGQYRPYNCFGYHIENEAFIAFLEKKAVEAKVDIIDGDVTDVKQGPSGEVESLQLAGGRTLPGDLFVDCSGFRSLLLEKALGEKYVSYSDSLFCDTAVVGSWQRDDEILPYTTTETMDHGWCWRIEFPDYVTRGYVFSSQYCTVDEAAEELRRKNPLLRDELRTVRFRSGRYENFWVKNVIAVGNSSGFIEPLEATALQLIAEQLRFAGKALLDSQGLPPALVVELENRRYREIWDDVRDFLAVHYKFNRRLDTPFWRHCRDHVNLAGAAPLVAYYQQAGPSILSIPLIPRDSIFGFDGYMTLLLGQGVATAFTHGLGEEDLAAWEQYRRGVSQQASQALPMKDAIRLVCGRT